MGNSWRSTVAPPATLSTLECHVLILGSMSARDRAGKLARASGVSGAS